jgi:hypothetical protein
VPEDAEQAARKNIAVMVQRIFMVRLVFSYRR